MVFTVGHSTRELEAFIALLQAYGIKELADVRTIPRSRRNPQFNRDTLPDSLDACGIDYVHLAGLGGLRHPKRDSGNTGWRNSSFRGYADYMQTPEFETALGQLLELAARVRTVIMCAEALPWRCHRSLIADALLVRGVHVMHILSLTHCQSHSLTAWAQVDGTLITYPKPQDGSEGMQLG
jgi:uncharacterized protein (DUF488 family)